jgi:RNA polymerase sigma-70 factor (ECF subfamily)
MNLESGHTTQIQSWLNRLNNGEESAREKLIEYSCTRLYRLVRKIFKGFPKVKRWEETDDVFQLAVRNLHNALVAQKFVSMGEYFAYASKIITNLLIDLNRRYGGSYGLGAKHSTVRPDSEGQLNIEPAARTPGPVDSAYFTETLSLIKQLPPKERDACELHFIMGMSYTEVASVLDISEETVKRRCKTAKSILHKKLRVIYPEI